MAVEYNLALVSDNGHTFEIRKTADNVDIKDGVLILSLEQKIVGLYANRAWRWIVPA